MVESGAQKEAIEEEINSERWLYVTLMSVLTVGYVHLMIFVAVTVIMVVYGVSRCFSRQQDSNVGLLSPIKLWLFIDEGIFSLLDELDEIDQNLEEVNTETRAAIERRLALEKLDEKPFETVRLDTID